MAAPLRDWESRIGRRLKLRDLHILSAVVQWGSMSQAATHLSLTQPAVSDAIATLEDALRVRLLDRTSKGIEPTIYATALLKRGRVVFDELRQGIRDIEFLADPSAGEVRIGCPESLAAGLVPAIIDRLSRRYPRVDVHVVHVETATLEFRELRERSVDLVVGRILAPLADDEIEAEILFEDRRLVVAGARSRWSRRRKIELADLVHEQWILDPPSSAASAFIAGAFRAHGLEVPRRSVATFSVHVRSHLLSTGRFLAIMQDSTLRFCAKPWSIRVLPIDLDIAPRQVAIFALRNRTLSPAVQRFVEHAREVAKSIARAH
jgi:DNA-binding transcriptional LysR family regulator